MRPFDAINKWDDLFEQLSDEFRCMVSAKKEIERLSEYIMKNLPNEITGGSAVDVAIKIMERIKKPGEGKNGRDKGDSES